MKGYAASSMIRATPQAGWAVLAGGSRWMDWDAAVTRLDGTIALGPKRTLYPEMNPDRGFAVRVVELVPSERITWRGGMPPSLFTGTRTYG
jgi:hypothetical protein